MHIDFHENHHDKAEYSLSGEVRDINAIFVDIVAESGYTIDKNNNFKPVAIDNFDGHEKVDAYAPFGNEPCGYYLELHNVEITRIDDAEDEFSIEIGDICAGWESIKLIFNKIELPFEASYIGDEPLSTLIEAADLLDDKESHYYIEWKDEPGYMKLELKHEALSDKLLIDIEHNKEDDSKSASSRHWNIEMQFSQFRNAVVRIAKEILCKYGFIGFIDNWDYDQTSFPIGSLLSILGAKSNSYSGIIEHKSDLQKEIAILNDLLANTARKNEKNEVDISDDEFFKVLNQESNNNMSAVEKLCKNFNLICSEVVDGKWAIGLRLDDAFLIIDPLALVNSIYRDECFLYLCGTNKAASFKVESIRQQFCYEWILSHTRLEIAGRCFYTYHKYQSTITNAVNKLYAIVKGGATTVYDDRNVNEKNLELCHLQLGAKWVLPSSDKSFCKPKSSEIAVEEFHFYSTNEVEKCYIGIGNRGFDYSITDWDNDYDSIRHQLECFCYGHDTTIHLYYDTTDWWIKLQHRSILKSVDQLKGSLTLDYDHLALVSIITNEIGLSPILTGYCDKKKAIRNLYEGLLQMALSYPTQADDLYDCRCLHVYNKIKSPIIENWINGANLDSVAPKRRQTIIDAVWIINPDYDVCVEEITDDRIPFDVNKDTFADIESFKDEAFSVYGFSSWATEIRDVIIASEIGKNYNFDWKDYHKRGLILAQKLRDKLPDYIDLWYEAPFEDKSETIPHPILIM